MKTPGSSYMSYNNVIKALRLGEDRKISFLFLLPASGKYEALNIYSKQLYS